MVIRARRENESFVRTYEVVADDSISALKLICEVEELNFDGVAVEHLQDEGLSQERWQGIYSVQDGPPEYLSQAKKLTPKTPKRLLS
jgi:hypothetical protein